MDLVHGIVRLLTESRADQQNRGVVDKLEKFTEQAIRPNQTPLDPVGETPLVCLALRDAVEKTRVSQAQLVAKTMRFSRPPVAVLHVRHIVEVQRRKCGPVTGVQA